MIRKMIYQLISVCLLFGALVSCSSEDELKKSASDIGISLELKTTGQTRSSVEPGTEAERQISAASVWFFGTGAGAVDKAVLYKKITSLSSTGSLTLNFTDEELRLHNMSSEGIYEIFVVANLPADASINEQTTLANLKGYSYTATTRPGSPFCMAGNSVGVHDFGKNSQLSIPLLRAASRLDITVKNTTGKAWSINKISIAEDQKSVLLFAPVTGSAAPASDAFKTAQDILTTATTNDEVTCSGYIYENRSTSSVKVIIEGTVDGTAKTWTSELKPNGSATLPRNTICGVTLNLKDKVINPVDIVYSTSHWFNSPMDTEIQTTYLKIHEGVISVYPVSGGLLHFESNATKVFVDWSRATDFFVKEYPSNTNVVIESLEALKVLTFDTKKDNAAEGIVMIKAGSLSRDIPIKKIDSELIFDVVSVNYKGHEVKNGDIIPWDMYSENGNNTTFNLTINRNVEWYCQYQMRDPNGTRMVNKTQRSAYNGIAGEQTVSFNNILNNEGINGMSTITLDIKLFNQVFNIWYTTMIFYVEKDPNLAP